MGQQRKVFARRQLIIERHEHAAAKENGIGRNQPFGLIAHQDRRAMAGSKSVFLPARRDSKRRVAKLPIGQAAAFLLSICLDEADFLSPTLDCAPQSSAERFVLAQIEHANYSLAWMRLARVRKSVTPWTS